MCHFLHSPLACSPTHLCEYNMRDSRFNIYNMDGQYVRGMSTLELGVLKGETIHRMVCSQNDRPVLHIETVKDGATRIFSCTVGVSFIL